MWFIIRKVLFSTTVTQGEAINLSTRALDLAKLEQKAVDLTPCILPMKKHQELYVQN